MLETQKLDMGEEQSNTIEGRKFWGLAALADRWGVSLFSVRRQVAQGNLRVINVGARLLVPAEEVLRVETQGVGERKRRPRASKTARSGSIKRNGEAPNEPRRDRTRTTRSGKPH